MCPAAVPRRERLWLWLTDACPMHCIPHATHVEQPFSQSPPAAPGHERFGKQHARPTPPAHPPRPTWPPVALPSTPLVTACWKPCRFSSSLSCRGGEGSASRRTRRHIIVHGHTEHPAHTQQRSALTMRPEQATARSQLQQAAHGALRPRSSAAAGPPPPPRRTAASPHAATWRPCNPTLQGASLLPNPPAWPSWPPQA